MITLKNLKDYPLNLKQKGKEFVLPPRGMVDVESTDGLIGYKPGELLIIDIFNKKENKKITKKTTKKSKKEEVK